MELRQLMTNFPKSGKVEWIGLRAETRGDILSVEEAKVTVKSGLEGDHYKGSNKKRQVTLIQAEHLKAVAEILEINSINPALTRRNIVVSGINLLALHKQFVQIGTVILEITGYCHPCSRMEQNLGNGGYNAMRGHGGLTAKVIQDGQIKVGDQVKRIGNPIKSDSLELFGA